MRIHVTVTAEDIRNGERGNILRCAVARALGRVVPGFYACGSGRFSWSRDDGALDSALLPVDVSVKIRQIDVGNDVKPFEFDVELP